MSKRIIAYTIMFLVFYGLFLVSYANAATLKLIVERVGPRAKKSSGIVTVINILDNQNGTTTIHVDACGTELKITINDEDIRNRGRDVTAALEKSVEKYCEPGGKK